MLKGSARLSYFHFQFTLWVFLFFSPLLWESAPASYIFFSWKVAYWLSEIADGLEKKTLIVSPSDGLRTLDLLRSLAASLRLHPRISPSQISTASFLLFSLTTPNAGLLIFGVWWRGDDNKGYQVISQIARDDESYPTVLERSWEMQSVRRNDTVITKCREEN